MKKILPFLLAFLLVLCSGCTNLSSDMSSGEYLEYIYSSNVQYVYEESTSAVESVVSQIESDIGQMVEAGDATVSRETDVYVTDADQDSYTDVNQVGKQSAVIDSSVTNVEAQEIAEADVNTTGTKPLYYSYLTETQQRIYRLMKTAAENMQTGYFSLGASSSDEDRLTDITIALRALSSDNPQIFWLPSTYAMSPDGSKITFSNSEKNIDYTMSAERKAIYENRLNSVVSQLTAEAKKLDSRFEKELYFHDWLCQNVTYGTDGTDDSYTAYGALVNGIAVCEGYSRAMQLLCDSVGIPCTVIYGYSNGVGHMWNIIDPGDGWYHLDVTWDDDSKYGVTRHAYFNVTDTDIKKDHTIFDVVTVGKSYVGTDYFNLYLYNCNSTYYNYFIKKKLVFGDDTAANAQIITKAVQNGQTSVEIMYNNSDYINVLNNLNSVLYEQGIFINQYSPLGSSIVLWLTFV